MTLSIFILAQKNWYGYLQSETIVSLAKLLSFDIHKLSMRIRKLSLALLEIYKKLSRALLGILAQILRQLPSLIRQSRLFALWKILGVNRVRKPGKRQCTAVINLFGRGKANKTSSRRKSPSTYTAILKLFGHSTGTSWCPLFLPQTYKDALFRICLFDPELETFTKSDFRAVLLLLGERFITHDGERYAALRRLLARKPKR